MRGRAVVVAVAAVLAASCDGGGSSTPVGGPEAPPTGAVRPRCDVPRGRAPEGFLLVRSTERPHRDHVGLHIVYRSPEGARLDYLVGVTGEVGEGLPLAEELELATGERARLLGRGESWVLVWPEAPPCAQSAIIGNRMDRGRFDAILEDAGILS